MRVLGLDMGKVRIGVALSDETGTIASPLTTLDARESMDALSARIGDICIENQVDTIVIGLPLSMSGGDRGESARMVRIMGRALGAALGIPVTYLDERFTSTQAERALVGANVSRKRRKNVIDKVAASLILQTYLDGRQGDES
jgi:putative holliday junction resolvase